MTSESTTDKPFRIEKRRVYEACKAVKANRGAAGVDGQTLEIFEKDLAANLYKIRNRMSSGTYFPPPVRAVSIPKKGGGERVLGVPTVSDRIAQMVVKQMIEPDLDSLFLPDSYGYRSGKSALDAVGVTRQRCWKYDWVLEFDIKGLFDKLPHDLLLKAVRKDVKCNWALLYIERWLTAPMEKNGEVIERSRGTPQGGVVSPILANLFLHYAFDLWMTRTHPDLPWRRYADDGLVHCQSERQGRSPQGGAEFSAVSVRTSDASDKEWRTHSGTSSSVATRLRSVRRRSSRCGQRSKVEHPAADAGDAGRNSQTAQSTPSGMD
ncbi:group II intron reverse transcriptase/maturase [Sinorhizobium meliloti]|uniref:group II intron reverse transcriptase/maturase n=1 Tax=Rhizobium meliloti TaxID=382 RepID=UPI001F474E52|nr:group II intron reverse transcriptase/maturase [Sinorhizobium meliloti]